MTNLISRDGVNAGICNKAVKEFDFLRVNRDCRRWWSSTVLCQDEVHSAIRNVRQVAAGMRAELLCLFAALQILSCERLGLLSSKLRTFAAWSFCSDRFRTPEQKQTAWRGL